jgi:hypothetical protein
MTCGRLSLLLQSIMLSPHVTESVCHAADASWTFVEESEFEPVSEQASLQVRRGKRA